MLYATFKDWCTSNGERVIRGNDFSEELRGSPLEVRFLGRSSAIADWLPQPGSRRVAQSLRPTPLRPAYPLVPRNARR